MTCNYCKREVTLLDPPSIPDELKQLKQPITRKEIYKICPKCGMKILIEYRYEFDHNAGWNPQLN
jgi:DNA-directed RNA polymerase subunit RPC12/RpoP